MVRCRAAVAVVVILVVSVGINEVKTDTDHGNKEMSRLVSETSNEEFIRQIHSMMNMYRGELAGEQTVIETNALINTKYKTWKRNADLINSLLALPKGMNDAGR